MTSEPQSALAGANLSGSDLTDADLSGSAVVNCDLTQATLVRTRISEASFVDCRIFSLSAWFIVGIPKLSRDLVITPDSEPSIVVDDLEAAQFVYLMLNNEKIRQVIDNITKTGVLILGRFGDRKFILDEIRQALRERGYTPMLFDFEVPDERNLTETITLLARMSRFVIADLTDPASIPQELQAIVPHFMIPVQPLIEGQDKPYSMSKDFVVSYSDRFLKLYRYEGLEDLIENLDVKVIAPAENRVKEFARKQAKSLEDWD